jgi:ribosomal protein S21
VVRRFKIESARSGVLQDLRHRKYFETTHDKKKRKDATAKKKDKIQRTKDRRDNTPTTIF